MNTQISVKEALKEAVLEISVAADGKQTLSCEAAHNLAANSAFTLKEIGAHCNDEKIRIVKCELGCF